MSFQVRVGKDDLPSPVRNPGSPSVQAAQQQQQEQQQEQQREQQQRQQALGETPAAPRRVFLKELDVPSEVQEVAQEFCERQGIRHPRDRTRIEEELKLQFHYGGQTVVCLETPLGRQVIGGGVPGSGDLRRAIGKLSREEREKAVVISVEPWNQEGFSTTSVSLSEEGAS